jgi:Mg2+ and Co2+ transporter CorA
MSNDMELDELARTVRPGDPEGETRGNRQSPPNLTQMPRNTNKMPLFEAVKKCFSAKSPLRTKGHSYLSPIAPDTASYWIPRVQLVSAAQGNTTTRRIVSLEDLWTNLEGTATAEHAVIVIRGIDDEWCEALCHQFPQHVNESFLLEHILGLTLPARCTCDRAAPATCRSIQADIGSVVRLLAGQVDAFTRRIVGFHIDCWREQDPAADEPRQYNACKLLKASERVQSSGFVSCCRLRENLCKCPSQSKTPYQLILISSTALALVGREPLFRDPAGSLCVKPLVIPPRPMIYWFGYDIRVPDYRSDIPSIVTNLFEEHVQVLAWLAEICVQHDEDERTSLKQALITMLLTMAALRDHMRHSEDRLRALAYGQEAGNDEQTFASLAAFRRGLGQIYRVMRDLRTFVESDILFASIQHTAHGLPHEEERPSKVNPNLVKALQTASLREYLLGKLSDLQKQLDAVKESINEEIQVAIGAVQVHDAQIMKKQTTWTVTLTVLAAIYLPLTLVTGIFGMNITEISSEATAPSARWVVAAWVVAFALTAGGIAIYVVLRKWRDQARERKKGKRGVRV